MKKRNIALLDTSGVLALDSIEDYAVISIVEPGEEHPECLWHHDDCYMMECHENAKWDSDKLAFTEYDCEIINELINETECGYVIVHCRECGPMGQSILLALLEEIRGKELGEQMFSLHMKNKRTHKAKQVINSPKKVKTNPDADIYLTLSSWFTRDSAH